MCRSNHMRRERERERKVPAAFMNPEKIYDRIDKEAMWNVLNICIWNV